MHEYLCDNSKIFVENKCYLSCITFSYNTFSIIFNNFEICRDIKVDDLLLFLLPKLGLIVHTKMGFLIITYLQLP